MSKREVTESRTPNGAELVGKFGGFSDVSGGLGAERCFESLK